MKKKILYLSGAARVSTDDNYGTSGARSHVLGIINGFVKCGWVVDKYIYGDILLPRLKKMKTNGFKHQDKGILKRVAADIIRIFLNWSNSNRALKKYNDTKIVYERLGAFQLLGYKFKIENSSTWILETNSILYHEADKDRNSIFFVNICRYYEKKAYENADYIIVVTESLKKMIIDEFNIQDNKIIILPNAVDTERFNPQEVEVKRLSSKTVIGFVGNLIQWAGINILIEAVNLIENKDDLQVVIIGDGSIREDWEIMTKDKKVDKYFEFIGSKPWSEIPSFIAGFDICFSGQINTSDEKMYHSPLKIYEYLAMGKPVIASEYDDANKLIKPGINGFLFEPGSANSLSKAIQKFLDSKKQFNSREDFIREEIIRNHSWETRVKHIINYIE